MQKTVSSTEAFQPTFHFGRQRTKVDLINAEAFPPSFHYGGRRPKVNFIHSLRLPAQMMRIMRLLTILFFAACLSASASGSAQTVTISGKSLTYKQVFTAIEQQTGFVVFYDQDIIPGNKTFTISVRNRPLAEFLNLIFKDEPLKYGIEDKTIFISSKPLLYTSDDGRVLHPEEIPPIDISGRVTDNEKNPLPGANVAVKGTSKGTVTDEYGRFKLENVEEDAIMEISFIGYETKTVPVKGKTIINIELNQSLSTLDDAVKIAYGTSSRRMLTGNVMSVKSKDIENQAITSPIVALQGRMAGVEITQLSGMPGAAPSIRIRGRNSIRYDANEPLYIVDGVPVDASPISTNGFMLRVGTDPLSTLNMANIESIEILKDADATAIYGSRGANGVVLISTKQGKPGKQGKITAEVNVYAGAGRIPNFMELMNTQQYLQMRREAFANTNTTPTAANAVDLVVWDTTRYTDWQRELMGGTSSVSNFQASVFGGSAQTNFRVGTAFQRHGTLFPGNFYYQKLNGYFSINHGSKNGKLKVMLSANYGNDNNQLFTGGSSDISNAAFLPPNAPAVYDENGNLNWENSTWLNPMAVLQKPQHITNNNININSTISYNISKDLVFKTTMGYTHLTTKQISKTPKSSLSPSSTEESSASLRTSARGSWIIEPQMNYSRKIGKSELDILIGTTFQKNTNETLVIQGVGFVDESLMENLGTADNLIISPGNTGITEYNYTAIFGRISYNWNREYLLNLTGRRDGSSRFGPGKRFANLGAVGAGWIFTEKPFVQRALPFLSYGKIRSSYGITGSDQIGDYGYLDTWGPTNGAGGLYPTQLANPDYSWETNNKFEVGLELGFINDRIQVSTSFYNNRSSNQLVGYPLSYLTGFTSVQANLPATVQNRGWEFELNTVNMQSRHFSWTSSGNFSIPRNKLIEYPNIEQSSYANTYVVGEPLSIQFLYQYTGLDPKTGLYTVLDVNEDGRYDAADRIVYKNVGRIFYGGFSNTFTFKSFKLDFLLEAVKHVGAADARFLNNAFAPGVIGTSSSNIQSNVLASLMGRWQQEDDNTNIQKFLQGAGDTRFYSYARGSEAAYNTDASFIRLKTLSISYELPEKLISKIGIGSTKLYFQGQNLFTITRYEGWDAQSPYPGAVPALRMLTGGIQVRF